MHDISVYFRLLHMLHNKAGYHSIWEETCERPRYVVCVGHAMGDARYTEGFNEKQEALDFWGMYAIQG